MSRVHITYSSLEIDKRSLFSEHVERTLPSPHLDLFGPLMDSDYIFLEYEEFLRECIHSVIVGSETRRRDEE
jgi:hypothetical protein